MPEIYLTSDTHYSHANILKYCKRPFKDIYEHDTMLVENFNSLVKQNDIVYHIGDFCLGPPWAASDIYHRLNGTIHLIKGNHDRLKNYKGLFYSVQDVLMLEIGKVSIWLSHYAHARWPHAHHGALHCFGHSHGGFPGLGRSMDVGVDTNNYFPYHVDEVVKRLSKVEMVKHHGED